MTITIDRAGRIVVPKPLRDRFGLGNGAQMEVEVTAEGIHLRPHNTEPGFVEKQGVLVHHGPKVAMDIDIAAFINRQRDAQAFAAIENPGM